MSRKKLVAIFDIGKTNKKLLLFDESYNIVSEESVSFAEAVDEDGFPCEQVSSIQEFISGSMHRLLANPEFEIKAVNFSAYGASFVNIGEHGEVVTPLYNYLKPFPKKLQESFYTKYGGEEYFSRTAASPVLGNLNSGMQLYRLKYEKPQQFSKIKYALHLPQWLVFLLSRQPVSDLTSIGCHTNLWDFTRQSYQQWVGAEGIEKLLAPILPGNHTFKIVSEEHELTVGIGLHDSSAALIPYLSSYIEPFLLISTGTWCISMNPFNESPLTDEELKADCLCFLSYTGKPVKASRLFAGYEHDRKVESLAIRFGMVPGDFKTIAYDAAIVKVLKSKEIEPPDPATAYHQLMLELVEKQKLSSSLVLSGSSVKRIYVDGGFSNNQLYMQLLANALPEFQVFAASMPQATALGAALAIHGSWNSISIPASLINKKYFSPET